MLRSDVLQALLDRYVHPGYLEIGVFRGETFHAIRADRKVAVDPQFHFAVPQPAPRGTVYYEVASDVYFGRIVKETELFEVIYLDGLHTFEQTLRDLLNAIAHLAPGGVIVVDDILPSTFYAAVPDYETFDQLWRLTGQGDASWMGDVFKLLFFVQSFLQPFSYATVADNHGQLVLWRRQRSADSIVHRRIAAFLEIGYPDVLLQRNEFNIQPLANILLTLPAPS